MTKKQRDHLPRTPAPAAHPDAEEVVHVPKGTSKLRFFLMFFGAIFVLIVLAAGDYLPSLFSSNPATAEVLSWSHPTRGVQRYTGPEYIQVRRSLEDFYRAQGQNPRLDDQGVAYHMVTNVLAAEAGVDVTKAEMARAILQGEPNLTSPFFSKENYEARLRQAGVRRAGFESMLREVMRVRRYELMLASAVGMPTPESLEKTWKEQNQEHAFQGASLLLADLVEEAAAELPPDEELDAWYQALPDRRARFAAHMRPERFSAEIVGWRPGTEDKDQALIDAYPVRDPETAIDAQRFYDSFAHVRYKRPAPLEASEEDPDGIRNQLYLPFEEVAEQAEQDAKVFMAMGLLIEDLRSRREVGKDIDLEGIALGLGLHFERVEGTHTQQEWAGETDSPPSELADPFFAGNLAMSAADGFSRRQILSPKGIFLARVPEHLPAGLPDFAEVREEVVQAWARDQALVKARARVGELREALVPLGTPEAEAQVAAEAFEQAATEAGLAFASVDWFRGDELAKAPEEELEPLQQLLRAQMQSGGGIYQLEAGHLSEPLEGPQGTRLWLLRSEGSRDPERVRIRPADLETLRMFAGIEGYRTVKEQMLAYDVYEREYGLKFTR